jgi:hypothetical protein
MAYDRVANLRVVISALRAARGLEKKTNPHVLGGGATQAHLFCEVAAQRASDEEERLAILDR